MPRPVQYLLRDLTLGWIPNPPDEAIAHQSWADALNVRFRDRAAERIRDSGQFGSQSLTYTNPATSATAADPITGITQYNSGTSNITLCFTGKEIYKEQSTAGSPWDTDQGDRLGARYITGTVTTTGADNQVTGAGTLWITGSADTGYVPKAGDWMLITGGANYWAQIKSVDADGTITLTAVYTVANAPGTAYVIRLLHTGTYKNAWITAEYHDPSNVGKSIMIATNGVDPILKWDGTGQFERLLADTDPLEGIGATTQGLRAKALAVWRNLVWVGDTTENGNRFPYRLRCCNLLDASGATGWEQPGVGIDYASYWDLPWGGDRIMALMPLSDNSMLVYKERSIWRIDWRGLSFGITDFIEIHEVTTQQGAMSRTSVASNGLVHCFADTQNIYLRALGYDAQIVHIGDTIKSHWVDKVNRNGADVNRVFWRADTSEFWIMFSDESGASPGTSEALVLYLPNAEWRPDVGELALPVWSRVEMPDCTACGRLVAQRGLTWQELSDMYGTWDAIPAGTTWNDLFIETGGQYLWGDVNGRTYYFERDLSDGTNAVERTGQLDTKLHSLGDPTVPKCIYQPMLLTDSTKTLVKAHVALSETPRWADASLYGVDGQVNGKSFLMGENTRLYGKFAGLRLYLYKGDAEEKVRSHGYGFMFVPGGKAR